MSFRLTKANTASEASVSAEAAGRLRHTSMGLDSSWTLPVSWWLPMRN